MPIQKIISGGQTGVDQAALEVAKSLNLDHGGWCPPGRIAENGTIPLFFNLLETPTERSPNAKDVPRSLRTEWNVRDSDGTLIIRPSDFELDPGTAWTIQFANLLKKPVLILAPGNYSKRPFSQWVKYHAINVLNVAGPSENTYQKIGAITFDFLKDLLDE